MNISIVTINLNNFKGLQDTLRSVETWKHLGFEYIVVDGISTDGSQDLIENSKIIDKFVIEKDTGVFNAMNKGVELATRDYIYFLNSGDILLDGICKVQLEHDIEYYNVRTIIGGVERRIDLRAFPIHQGVVMLKSILRSNKFDETLKVFGDLDLWYRIGYRVSKSIPQDIALMYVEGIGSAPEFLSLRLKDKWRLFLKHRKVRDILSIAKILLMMIVNKIFGKDVYYFILR